MQNNDLSTIVWVEISEVFSWMLIYKNPLNVKQMPASHLFWVENNIFFVDWDKVSFAKIDQQRNIFYPELRIIEFSIASRYSFLSYYWLGSLVKHPIKKYTFLSYPLSLIFQKQTLTRTTKKTVFVEYNGREGW